MTTSKSDFIPVDIASFRNTTRDIRFDVFLKLAADNYAHVFSRSTGLDYKRLAQYVQKGILELYIRKEDEEVYLAFIAKTAESIFNDPTTPHEIKINTLLQMTEQNISELLYYANVSQPTAESAQKLVRKYVDLMIKDSKSLALILKMVSHGEYLYYHSIAVSIFSMFIAKASGQFNARMLEIVGLGGFLHDIGTTQMDSQILLKEEELTEKEWAVMKDHPKVGLTMVENNPLIPDEAKYIIYQHHEEVGGEGYPNRLRGPVIYYPAKIVAIADAFSALISKRPWRPAYTLKNALEKINSKPGKYDRDILKLFSSVFMRSDSGSDDIVA